jgi:glutamate-1-semialdehyde aminotransferase
MGKGPVTLGHGRPEVNEAAFERAKRGGLLPGIGEEYAALAERLASHLAVAESSMFTKNGSDAVVAAMRLARVHTGRRLVLSAGYHGWDERVRGEDLADASESAAVLDFGYDLAALESALERLGERCAAILVTPEPAFFGPELLQTCRALSERVGALLVVDEVRCGLRVAFGGAHELHGVAPDLVCLSKGLANGFPLAAVCGRREVMEASLETFIFSTHYGEGVALAAALAALEISVREDTVGHMARVGAELMRGLDGLFEEHGVAARPLGPPSMPTLLFEEPAVEDAFFAGSAGAGVLFFQDDAQCLSLAHDAEVVAETLERLEPVVASLPAAGWGEPSDATIERYAARRMIGAGLVDAEAVRADPSRRQSRAASPSAGSTR